MAHVLPCVSDTMAQKILVVAKDAPFPAQVRCRGCHLRDVWSLGFMTIQLGMTPQLRPFQIFQKEHADKPWDFRVITLFSDTPISDYSNPPKG